MLTWQDYKAMPFTQCVIDSLFFTLDCLELKFDEIIHLKCSLLSKFVVSILNIEKLCQGFILSLDKQVIDETLRLGGIAIWLMREAKEDIQYQGIKSFLLIIG